MSTWREQWIDVCDKIPAFVPYEQSAEDLRRLIRTKLLKFTDIRNNPARFFEAHRLLLNPKIRGPGFGIRFTVQFNLFAGTILGLGTSRHHELLNGFQEKGVLGCFALTERLAGVNSGLIVNTTATWVPDRQMFLLNCPTADAVKNWISQGLTASKCVVIANLIIKGRSYGPNGFLIDLRRKGALVDGITLGDMGKKTTGNDLDNAWIRFENVWIPKTSHLNRFSDIQNDQYVQTTNEKMRLEIIGQRLLSGRVAISQAALVFTAKLFERTRKYSNEKLCWGPKNNRPLSEIPQLKSLYKDYDVKFAELWDFVMEVEKRLCECLKKDVTPSKELVEAIAVSKVKAVERSIDFCYRLKQEVGGYALMGGTGFEHTDFLQCCKFAEGDSRILMQKMSRDRLKSYIYDQRKNIKIPDNPESRKCKQLISGGKANWNKNWAIVYGLANDIMDRTMNDYVGKHSRL